MRIAGMIMGLATCIAAMPAAAQDGSPPARATTLSPVMIEAGSFTLAQEPTDEPIYRATQFVLPDEDMLPRLEIARTGSLERGGAVYLDLKRAGLAADFRF